VIVLCCIVLYYIVLISGEKVGHKAIDLAKTDAMRRLLNTPASDIDIIADVGAAARHLDTPSPAQHKPPEYRREWRFREWHNPTAPLPPPPPEETPMPSLHAFAAPHRLIDSEGVVDDGSIRHGLRDFFPSSLPPRPLLQTLAPFLATHTHLLAMVRKAEMRARTLDQGVSARLSVDERAALLLYTMEVNPLENSVSWVLMRLWVDNDNILCMYWTGLLHDECYTPDPGQCRGALAKLHVATPQRPSQATSLRRRDGVPGCHYGLARTREELSEGL
jgi:hypothetical protein